MSTKAIHVLLIEDNSDDAFLIQRFLSKSVEVRFNVRVAHSLAVGLANLDKTETDIILLDLTLEDSNGLDTLNHVVEAASEIPIVVLTGLTDGQLGIQAVQSGAQDYLTKTGLDGNLLERAIRYAIQRKQIELELRRHQEHLEDLVAERTAELITINEQLQQEIAERKQAEQAEREQRILAEAIRDTANALNSTLTLPEILERILDNIALVVPYDAAEIMLIESGSAFVVRCHGYGINGNDLPSQKWSVAETPGLRYMAETRQPLIISDLATSEMIINQTSDALWRSYLGTAILSHNELIGFIGLNSLTPQCFSAAHGDRLQAFAEQAAIAILNVRLREQEHALAAMQERERLARDLHDAVSQTLFSASVIAETLARHWERNPEKVQARLTELHQLTRGALAEMRTLLLELRPSALQGVELPDLLRQLVEAIQSRKRISIAVQIEGETTLSAETKLALYRIAQEALNNVAKHARATRATVSLISRPDQIRLSIEDNGRGFDPGAVQPASLGLNIMRERASTVGASLSIHTQPAQGTRITVDVPVSQQK